MKKILWITISVIIFILCYNIFADNKLEQILTVGEFHGNEVSAVDDDEWYILYLKNNSFFLEKGKISISLVEDAVIDNPGEKTGKKVSVNIDGQPIILLKDFKNISPDKISTNIKEKLIFVNNDSIKTKLIDNEYIIWMQIIDTKAKLLFSNGKNQQSLAEFQAFGINDSTYYFGDDATPSLIWAGDLDQDNKLDLIMNLTDHYNVSEITLFLSSYASKNEMVKKVAVFRTVGC